MERFVFTLENADPAGIFSGLCRDRYSLWLDSAARAHSLARYSFIAFDPLETVESKNGMVTAGEKTAPRDPFAVLQERLAAYDMPRTDDPDLPPFSGGAAGFFSYDLARGIEKLPQHAADNPAMPDMAVGIYNKVVAFDHHRQQAWLIVHAENEIAAQRALQDLHTRTAHTYHPAQTGFTPQWRSSDSAEDYRAKVQRVIDYIHAGDIFQANLSQRFSAPLPDDFDAFAHYLHLRAVNPAPFAAFMNAGTVQIASASPERFLFVRGGHVDTRPIKGTRPRHADAAADRAVQDELSASEKDRAENAMIVDLLRNDLSKVCDDHSIDVPQLCGLESFATVHHLVSIVTGTLRPECDALDLLRAAFPGGSITGAPKVRAMEIIEELEPQRRGPYCGSIGYIGFNGTMDTNIAIRSLVYDGAAVSFNVGGGIVADSDPAAEYQETLDKGRALFASFESPEKRETGS